MSQTNRLIQSNGVDGEMYMYNVETERARRPEYELMMTLSGGKQNTHAAGATAVAELQSCKATDHQAWVSVRILVSKNGRGRKYHCAFPKFRVSDRGY